MSGTYRTIVADPPWTLPGHVIKAGGRRSRDTVIPYGYMDLASIESIPVTAMAADDAHLFLWCTRKVFREGQGAAVARAWGFEPVGELIWGLRNPGMGTFLGNDHEPVLVARRGDAKFKSNIRLGGVHFWRQTYLTGKVHSAKPEAFLDFVEQVSDGPYLEMFSRRHRFFWDTWGNESANTATVEVPDAAAS